MALLFMDGFDHYGTGTANVLKKWDGGSVTSVSTTNPRNGSNLQLNVGSDLMKLSPVPGSTCVLGTTISITSLPTGGGGWNPMQFMEGGTVHIAVLMETSGLLTIKRGSTVLATATANAFIPANWYYLEVKVVIDSSAGSVIVHLDGAVVPFNAPLTGINTRNGGTGVVDRFTISGVTNASPWTQFDDLYFCDGTGSTNNTFLGNCVIETLLPQVGNGDLTALTPSTGTDHGALVDENPANDDTDYNTGDTAGQTDCYNYPSLALTGTILGVQTDLYAKKTDAGARTVAPVFRIASTTYPGVAVAPTTSYRYLPAIAEINPATGIAWTSADITALQAGMKIVS